jgi:hypothetical protein
LNPDRRADRRVAGIRITGSSTSGRSIAGVRITGIVDIGSQHRRRAFAEAGRIV